LRGDGDFHPRADQTLKILFSEDPAFLWEEVFFQQRKAKFLAQRVGDHELSREDGTSEKGKWRERKLKRDNES